MRRAFAGLHQGRVGPVMVEIPADVALEEVSEADFFWSQRVRPVASQGNPVDIAAAARALCGARYPVIHAGQGVLYAGAYEELVELAELLQVPVMTTLLGKSAFRKPIRWLWAAAPASCPVRCSISSAAPTWCSASGAASPSTACP